MNFASSVTSDAVTHEYIQLIEAFCASSGLDDECGRVLQDGLIEVDDVPMRLEYVGTGDVCRILADLGDIPEERGDALRSFMLEANYENTEFGFPVLSVHPETRHAVLTLNLPMEDLTREGGLMRAIDEYVLPLVAWWDDVVESAEESPVPPVRLVTPAGVLA